MRPEPRRSRPVREDDRLIVVALGGAGIVSYGTLYYCVAAIAKEASRDLAVTEEWILGCFSLALLASALISLVAGRLMDRYGAGKTMRIASFAGGASLGVAAVSWDPVVFAIALFGMQLASAFLFYEAAFVFLVQRDAVHAKRQMALLTLIVGFSSTLFWPLTSLLLTLISWRQVCWIYGGCNVLLGLPLIQVALVRSSVSLGDQNKVRGPLGQSSSKLIDLVLITAGFSLTTFVFSALLGRMLPILSSIGLDMQGAALISTLFGPSQVAVRLFAGSFTERASPIQLTILSCVMLSAATFVTLLASHSLVGIAIFVAFVGFSSGLNSICRGSVPLSVFGPGGYGTRVGLITTFRLSTASFAPFLFSVIQNNYGIALALASLTICAIGSTLSFALLSARSKREPSP
ncbi:Predicted arabinose efflux permease, MFS family [Bradyrhizobium sp. Rc3b]|uniref:MFS transporter n=1 Tax=Bradyrhizobium sp. Rc3b TaxID=1855322 RepID=UPI0008EC0FDC|nr:MFS transporter [Bradyrhizobium sp. Rc3b]SFN76987.1 Predicted arabinose efflux permease, MFS family [Bradyrhizobium sp. Rc3b]